MKNPSKPKRGKITITVEDDGPNKVNITMSYDPPITAKQTGTFAQRWATAAINEACPKRMDTEDMEMT